jgi:xanthine dehydrogenase accessory factor
VRPMRRPPERRVGRQGEIGDARGAKARLDRLDVGGAGAGHVGRALAQALRFLHLSPRLIDQRQTGLDLAGPGTPTTPIGPARGGNPGRASWCRLTHDHALDFLLAVEALRRPDAVYVGMIASRTKRATFTRYAANEGVDARSLVCPIGASFPRDRRPEVMAAFAAAEIQTRMIERAHQGGSGAAGDRSGLLKIGP